MKFKYIFLLLLVPNIAVSALLDDYIDEFRGRAENEMKSFSQMAGWTSHFRSLAPSTSHGILGFDFGIEVTSIPTGAFRFDDQALDLPAAFPRVHVAKGITKYLDLEASLLSPKILGSNINIPEALESLLVLGGALKYTMLDEDDYYVSMAIRGSYTKTKLDFFNADIFSADLSLSREFGVPLTPLTLTPYLGAGYISTAGEFDKSFLPFVSVYKYHSNNYRYFGGLSLKLFTLELTGQMDRSGSRNLTDPVETYSAKISIDIDFR